MKTPSKDIFFIGFLRDLPAGLKRFLPVTSVVLLCLFAGLGFSVSATQDDPGDGRFRGDLGRQELTGVVHAMPYPTLWITEGTDELPEGHVLMLSGGGKRGAMAAEKFDGVLTKVQGLPLTRGDLTMLQLAGGSANLRQQRARCQICPRTPPSGAGGLPERSATANASPGRCGRGAVWRTRRARTSALWGIFRRSLRPPDRSMASVTCCWQARMAGRCLQRCTISQRC